MTESEGTARMESDSVESEDGAVAESDSSETPVEEESPAEAPMDMSAETPADRSDETPADADESGAEAKEAENDESAHEEPVEEDETADELTAAIADANERVDEESTLDDIAPGTVAVSDEAGQLVADRFDPAASEVSWWPFLVYIGVWVVAAGLAVWQLDALPAGQAVFEAGIYPMTVLGGIVLTVAGPLLVFAVWFASWRRPGARKGQLFISALAKGAVATLAGVTIWWAALILLDQLRLGSLV